MTQPKTASKFTPGALRAARVIADSITWHPDLDIQLVSHIIDRETGVAELLQAAKLAKAELRYYPGETNKEGDALVDAAYSALEQAIAKVEGK